MSTTACCPTGTVKLYHTPTWLRAQKAAPVPLRRVLPIIDAPQVAGRVFEGQELAPVVAVLVVVVPVVVMVVVDGVVAVV